MSRPLQSTSSPANNVLLRVTVPRRTGRRRKRGTDEPFTDEPGAGTDAAPGVDNADSPRPTASDLRQNLEDNVGKYQVETVGMVNRTHVFRGEQLYLFLRLDADELGMPDFVFSTAASPFTNRFRDQILSFDCRFSAECMAGCIHANLYRRQDEAVRYQHGQRCHL